MKRISSATALVRVRYAETDAMGVAYHGSYLPWFEEARILLLDLIGVPYRELEARGFRLPVLEAQLKYHQPARFDDRLAVTVTWPRTPGIRLHLRYEVRRGETLLCTGETHHAFINTEGRPTRPPADFLAAWALHAE